MNKWRFAIALILLMIAGGYLLEHNNQVIMAKQPAADTTAPLAATPTAGQDKKAASSEAANSTSEQSPKQHAKTKLPLDVPLIQQMPELARGCEVTSLAMLLNEAGVQVDKMTLAKQVAKVPFQNNGLHGDMNEGFVGDVYTFDNPGLGVYSDPIFALGKQYLPDKLVNLSGGTIDDLYDSLDNGFPVWVITTTKFAPLDDDAFQTWETANGSMKVTYKEHSVVMTGYDNEYVYINDPYEDEPNKKVSRGKFEKAWVQMGSQAISYVV